MLRVGNQVPNFTGINQYGKKIALSDYMDKKLIVFFYPKASTPGCTAQVCNLQNGYDMLKEKGFELLGVSADSVSKQLRFATSNGLDFNLIADESKEIINLFGVWGEKKFMGKTFDGIRRTTFILDEKHSITHVFHQVKTKAHVEQILSDWEKL